MPRHAAFLGKPCPYCGTEMLGFGHRRPTRDHVIPKRLPGTGFKDNPGNKLVVCWKCNNDKKHYSLEQWATRLHHVGDPRYLLIVAVIRSRAEIVVESRVGCDVSTERCPAPT